MCRFGRLVSASLCTRSLVHHARTWPAVSATLRGTYAPTALLAPSRHLPFVWLTIAATFSSAFFTVSTAALGPGVEGITDRNSSGMCDAPAPAVSETAAAIGPSDANVSSAARSGDDCAGLKTDARISGVAGAGRGTGGLACGAGAAAGAARHGKLQAAFKIDGDRTW